MTEEKRNQKQAVSEVKKYSVPFSLNEIKENITLNANNRSKLSKEQILKNAFQYHSQGNISEAAKYYQIYINQGFHDYRVFSNYGVILKNLGQLKDAELSIRKAIKINPDFAEAHANLGDILIDLGRLHEAELSTRKAIKIKPNIAEFHNNLAIILSDLGKLQEAELSIHKATKINPNYANSYWSLYSLSNNIEEAEKRIKQYLEIEKNHLKAQLTLCALKLHQGEKLLFHNLNESANKDHPLMRSIRWVSSLSNLPELFFHRWAFFDSMIKKSKKNRPFYEFGVWRGISFQYLINTFKKGYGFDTFEGLPKDWHTEKEGRYSADGVIPKIEGGKFIKGKFEETLSSFFLKPRPLASIINFDADLYSSTLCALNNSKNVIDQDTILIFDEFITNDNWEEDEYKALNEFCYDNNLSYKVLAISYITKQVAVKIIDL